jgi:hypothetical protein
MGGLFCGGLSSKTARKQNTRVREIVFLKLPKIKFREIEVVHSILTTHLLQINDLLV